MFKDVFTLKKTAWHAKLMKYIWGISYKDFSHICPYFWLSIFNAIIAPVFVPTKLLFIKGLPFVGRYFYCFMSWNYHIIEGWIKALNAKLDAWAVEQQRKWEERRKRELLALKENAVKKFKEITDNYSYILNRNDTYTLHTMERGNKKERRIAKWLRVFMDLHRIDKETFDKLLMKKNEMEIKEEEQRERERLAEEIRQTTKQMRRQAFYDSEEEQERLKFKAAIQEQEELKRLAAEMAKNKREQEQRDIKKLAEEAERQRRIRVKQRITKINKVIKPISTGIIYILGGSLCIVALYYLVKGVGLAYNFFANVPHTTYVNIGEWTVRIIVGLIILAILVGIVFILYQVLKRVKIPHINLPKVKFSKIKRILPYIDFTYTKRVLSITGRSFKYLFTLIKKGSKYSIMPFFWLVKGIALFFKILVQTIKNNCPAIEWKD